MSSILFGCNPSYGVAGSKKAEYCAQHALEGMVHVRSKKCAGDGCSKQPSYGVAGSKKAEYCAQHALEGMVDVYSKRCAGDGCSKQPQLRRSREQEGRVLRSACFGGDG